MTRLLIGLDFDGTLAPLVRSPLQARLSAPARALLARLARRPGVRVAIVSGRAAADLARRAAVPGAYLIGNHGLEISGPRLGWLHPRARHARADLHAVARGLRAELDSRSAPFLEDKDLTLSLHYRGARDSETRRLARALRRQLRGRAEALEVTPGKKVWNIHPRVAWDKGRALRELARRLGGRWIIMFVGDDVTDERGFKSLGRGAFTVRVGHWRRTAARYAVRGPGGVHELLRRLEGALP